MWRVVAARARRHRRLRLARLLRGHERDPARRMLIRPGMPNPRNFRDEPVCPICARTFKPGEGAMRADGCMVHVDCVDEAERRNDPCAPVG